MLIEIKKEKLEMNLSSAMNNLMPEIKDLMNRAGVRRSFATYDVIANNYPAYNYGRVSNKEEAKEVKRLRDELALCCCINVDDVEVLRNANAEVYLKVVSSL